MSKRQSKSAEFIGKFWNLEQHTPIRPRSPDWPDRAAGFVRFKLHEVREIIDNGRDQFDSPFSKLMADRESKARGILKQARDRLQLAQVVYNTLRKIDERKGAEIEGEVTSTTREVREFALRVLSICDQ